MKIQVLFYFAIFGYALPNVSYLQNFRFQFLIIRKLDPFFTKSVDFKHVSMATEESGNTSFVLFCYFGYALPNVSYLQHFRFQFLIIRKLYPFLPNLCILNTFPWQRKRVKICVLFYFAIFG